MFYKVWAGEVLLFYTACAVYIAHTTYTICIHYINYNNYTRPINHIIKLTMLIVPVYIDYLFYISLLLASPSLYLFLLT